MFVGLKQSSSQQSIQVFSSVGVPGHGGSHFAGALRHTSARLCNCIRMCVLKGQRIAAGHRGNDRNNVFL